MADIFTMTVETASGVTPHGFHLGTDLNVAEGFVFEQLRRPGTISVALYKGGHVGKRPIRIFDYRDLGE
jgi:hypothetical protein